jgi:Dynamitin.
MKALQASDDKGNIHYKLLVSKQDDKISNEKRVSELEKRIAAAEKSIGHSRND